MRVGDFFVVLDTHWPERHVVVVYVIHLERKLRAGRWWGGLEIHPSHDAASSEDALYSTRDLHADPNMGLMVNFRLARSEPLILA